MEELYLIYVNSLGIDWKGDNIYEFIFSNVLDVDGEDWDIYPASGNPMPPHVNYIKAVGRVECKLELEVVQNSDTFAVWDALDGIIALAWEDISNYNEYPDKRTCFKFGETIKMVEDKLYEKDLAITYNTNRDGKHKK